MMIVDNPDEDPWKLEIFFAGLPFTKGAIQGLVMQALIKFKKVELNPKEWRTEKRKECFTQSKAFSISSFRSIPFFFCEFVGVQSFLN